MDQDVGKIVASGAKYIKLGRQDEWAGACLKDGTIRLGFYEVPHEMGLSRDVAAIRKIYVDQGLSQGKASDFARQVVDFYHAPPDTVWITVTGDHVHWCQAQDGVTFLGQDKANQPLGSRYRRTVGGWRSASLAGTPLAIADLDGRLTMVGNYRSTICEVREREYLFRRINDEESPEFQRAEAARLEALGAISELIKGLHWPDFELLVELIFSRSGWQRESRTGGTQKTLDMLLLLPSTGERALVQVKSSTNQAEFREYLDLHEARGEERMFYVYHTPPQTFESPNAAGSPSLDRRNFPGRCSMPVSLTGSSKREGEGSETLIGPSARRGSVLPLTTCSITAQDFESSITVIDGGTFLSGAHAGLLD